MLQIVEFHPCFHICQSNYPLKYNTVNNITLYILYTSELAVMILFLYDVFANTCTQLVLFNESIFIFLIKVKSTLVSVENISNVLLFPSV